MKFCLIELEFFFPFQTTTETYSEWKKKFTKVMVDFNHLEYGEMIGEGV